MERRSFLAGCGLALGSTAGCLETRVPPGGSVAGEPIPVGPTVGLETVVRGPARDDAGPGPRFPVDLAVTEDGDHWYVADRAGTVWCRRPDGVVPTPALDVGDRVLTGGEQGLLGVVLHPEFARNGRLYLRYSAPTTPDAPPGYSHTAVLSEFRVDDDRTTVRPGTERRLLELAQPGSHHNGGALAFGPEGYLYASFGEGEWLPVPDARAPTQATDWYDWTDGGNGQDVTENLLGSVLRIDVDSEASQTPRNGSGEAADGEETVRGEQRPYAVPDDNPLVGREGLDEQYAWGFRNPWRMGFSGGDLYVADVGAYAVEEVDRVRAGGNYGWKVREGTTCFNGRYPDVPGPWCPEETPDGDPLLDPVVQYPHEVRTGDGVENRYSAVVGGYVYENDAVPSLTGRYVFGDFSGQLLVATPRARGLWPLRKLSVAGGYRAVPLAFARDAAGELLVLGVGRRGRVDRVVPAESGGESGDR